MALYSTLAGLNQSPALNAPDGAQDAPSTIDDNLRYLGSFIALLRDGKAGVAEVDVASASTCDIGAVNSPMVRITGTTGISSFGTTYSGPRLLRFAGVLTITHNASSLILPGAANIVTAAGDSCLAVPVGTSPSGWQVVAYQRANGTPLTLGSATVTPDKLSGGQTGAAPAFAARAWVRFNGTGTLAVAGSGNVGSVSDNGVGDYTINFTTPMPNANYAAVVSVQTAGSGSGAVIEAVTATTSGYRFRTYFNGAQADFPTIAVAVFC